MRTNDCKLNDSCNSKWIAINCAIFLLFRFMPSFLRLGSWNVVMFVTYEQLKRAMMAANRNYTTIL